MPTEMLLLIIWGLQTTEDLGPIMRILATRMPENDPIREYVTLEHGSLRPSDRAAAKKIWHKAPEQLKTGIFSEIKF